MAQDQQAKEIFSAAREKAKSYNLAGSSGRKALLKRLRSELIKQKEEAVKALDADFGKPGLETLYTEIYACVNEINYAIRHLRRWMNPKRAGFRLTIPGTSSYLAAVPKGCILIIAPSNFPVNLSIIPVINALAAGNTVVLKPSHKVPETNRFLKGLIEKVFPDGEVLITESDIDLAKALLKQPFDHIFFTGDLETGKNIMRAAAEIPCPVTLELGGRCPAIVHGPADLKAAARRIVWAKWLNGGQTCVAVNHVLVHEPLKQAFSEALLGEMKRAFEASGEHVKAPIARIIDAASWQRLCTWTDEALRSGASLLHGNRRDEADRYFSPTVLENVPSDAKLMQGEIFGPVLPIVSYSDWHELMGYLANERPLAIMLFTDDKSKQRKLFLNSRSGGFWINDVIAQLYHTGLPFGGVGSSGFGMYHGYFGFCEFSHMRPVIRRRFKTNWITLALQPYSEWKQKVANFILRFF